MASQTNELTWKIYQDAWADITAAERQDLLKRSVAEDCRFNNPDTEGRGVTELCKNIEEFQKLYPGAHFKTHQLQEHHGQALAEWVMYDKDGAEFLPGKSFARFGVDGRLTHLAGFWKR